jgi:hypothetical protein
MTKIRSEIIGRVNMPAQGLTRDQRRIVSIVTDILDGYHSVVWLSDIDREVDKHLKGLVVDIQRQGIIKELSKRFGAYEEVTQ